MEKQRVDRRLDGETTGTFDSKANEGSRTGKALQLPMAALRGVPHSKGLQSLTYTPTRATWQKSTGKLSANQRAPVLSIQPHSGVRRALIPNQKTRSSSPGTLTFHLTSLGALLFKVDHTHQEADSTDLRVSRPSWRADTQGLWGLRTSPLKIPGKGRGVATCSALASSPGISTCFPCQPRAAGTRGSGPRPRAAATRSRRMASLDQPLPELLLGWALLCTSGRAGSAQSHAGHPGCRALPGGRSGGRLEEGRGRGCSV